MSITPVVADMYHGNSLNLTELKEAHMWGIVHKARQGVKYGDSAYASRRRAAEAMGFLWAAYDFATHDDVAENVADFFASAQPGPFTGMCLDFEDNAASEMTGDQAWEFLDRVNQKLGRGSWIYGGNRLRDVDPATKRPRIDPQQARWIDMAKVVLLWQCRYISAQPESTASLFSLIRPIPPWTSNFMIQYTGDGAGPRPHTVAGLENGADLNAYNGTLEELTAAWPGLRIAA